MYDKIENRICWYESKIITIETKEELDFWLPNIHIYNGYTFKPRALTTCLIFTDAIDERYWRFILKHLNKEVFSAKLTTVKNKQISTQIITCR